MVVVRIMKQDKRANKKEDNPIVANPNTLSISTPAGFVVTLSTDELSIEEVINRSLDVYNFLSEKLKEKEKGGESYTG